MRPETATRPRVASSTAGETGRSPGLRAPRWQATTSRQRAADHLRRFARWETVLAVALAAVIATGTATSPEFSSATNIFNIGLSNGEVAIMTLPMTLIILAGEIDLSIASTMALGSSLIGYLWDQHWAMPEIIVFVVAVGVVCGMLNGLVITRLELPSLAVTIGTMTLYQGIAEILLGPTTVSGFPPSYTTALGVNPFPYTDLSYSAVVFIVLAVVFGVVLHATPFGRTVFAIGWNKEAALFAGIRVKRVKTLLFVVSGMIGALAGILYTLSLNTAEPDAGANLVLPVVAIALLGGVSIFGGKGTLTGVVLAVLVYCGLYSALLLTSFPEDALGIVPGALLFLSVALPNGRELIARARSFKYRHRSGAPQEAEGAKGGRAEPGTLAGAETKAIP
ncbi:MAG: ABC transporter permease [Acidimicrobiales bacterium]